jgi:putrescine transport system substrate-binding protein
MSMPKPLHTSSLFSGAGLALAVSCLFLSACSRPSGTTEGSGKTQAESAKRADNANRASNDDRIVRVYNWSEYVADDTIPSFQSQTGIRVEYNEYTSNQVLEANLKQSPNAYDVIFPSARPNAQQMIAAGQLQPLDKSRLPNAKHLDASIMAELDKIDPGNRYLVPYMWGTTGLGINVDKVKAALGPQAALDSWNLLFEPGNASKLSNCGIGIIDDVLEALSPALMWQGFGANDHSAEANAAAEKAFTAIRPYIRKFSGSTELIADLADGNLCLVLTFSGDALQARARAEELGNGNEIRYLLPREGALRWTDVIAIPKGSQYVEQAHAFIDYIMEPKVIASVTNYVAYANGNSGSLPLLDQNIAKDTSIYPTAATLKKLQTLQTTTPEQYQKRNEIWKRVVYGNL